MAATEKPSCSLLCGFLEGLQNRDDALTSVLLDEALHDATLAEWFPVLQASVLFDGKGLARLLRALAHPDHGNGLAGEPRLGPSVTLAPVWGVPSSQAASLWRSERNLAMRRGGGRARGGATQEPQQPQGFVPHPSRFAT